MRLPSTALFLTLPDVGRARGAGAAAGRDSARVRRPACAALQARGQGAVSDRDRAARLRRPRRPFRSSLPRYRDWAEQLLKAGNAVLLPDSSARASSGRNAASRRCTSRRGASASPTSRPRAHG